MKNTTIFLLSVLFLVIISCKSDQGGNNSFGSSGEYNPAPPDQDSLLYDPEIFMIPTPEGVYVPEGLKKMSVKEMYRYGRAGNDLTKLPLTDHLGNPMPADSFFRSPKKLFMQMYTDDSGRVAKTVVFEMTDELINKLKESK
jgi:hypothetical protein